MKSTNRDLLVLSKKATLDPLELEHEVEQLHQLLYYTETIRNLSIASEIIDVNNFKIITKPHKIERYLRENNLKPFQFISNKN